VEDDRELDDEGGSESHGGHGNGQVRIIAEFAHPNAVPCRSDVGEGSMAIAFVHQFLANDADAA